MIFFGAILPHEHINNKMASFGDSDVYLTSIQTVIVVQRMMNKTLKRIKTLINIVFSKLVFSG